MPLTVAPSAGLVTVTVGALSILSTVTLTLSLAVWLAVSVAVAVRVCDPSLAVVVSQLVDQPSLPSVSVAKSVPSRKNSTWVTPLSSVASAVTETVPLTLAPPRGAVRLTLGQASPLPATAATAWSACTKPNPVSKSKPSACSGSPVSEIMFNAVDSSVL